MALNNATEIACFSNLPTELISSVFSFLTPIEIVSLKNVHEKWKSIIESDKRLWNHSTLSTEDFDVKTSINFIEQMPLLRRINIGNVNSAEEMSQLIKIFNDKCHDLRQIKFAENCSVHPSAKDLHFLNYFHPKVEVLQIGTKSKVTKEELSHIGDVLSEFECLNELSLIGMSWHQNGDLITDLFEKLPYLRSLKLPAVVGLKSKEIALLPKTIPNITSLTLNIVNLPKNFNFRNFKYLKYLEIISSSNFSFNKMSSLKDLTILKSLKINLSNCNKKIMIDFFKSSWSSHARVLEISNCNFSDELLEIITDRCVHLEKLVWLHPKDSYGEITDSGFQKICDRLKNLRWIDIRSRCITRLYYAHLANLKGLKYIRINGMKVSGYP